MWASESNGGGVLASGASGVGGLASEASGGGGTSERRSKMASHFELHISSTRGHCSVVFLLAKTLPQGVEKTVRMLTQDTKASLVC